MVVDICIATMIGASCPVTRNGFRELIRKQDTVQSKVAQSFAFTKATYCRPKKYDLCSNELSTMLTTARPWVRWRPLQHAVLKEWMRSSYIQISTVVTDFHNAHPTDFFPYCFLLLRSMATQPALLLLGSDTRTHSQHAMFLAWYAASEFCEEWLRPISRCSSSAGNVSNGITHDTASAQYTRYVPETSQKGQDVCDIYVANVLYILRMYCGCLETDHEVCPSLDFPRISHGYRVSLSDNHF